MLNIQLYLSGNYFPQRHKEHQDFLVFFVPLWDTISGYFTCTNHLHRLPAHAHNVCAADRYRYTRFAASYGSVG